MENVSFEDEYLSKVKGQITNHEVTVLQKSITKYINISYRSVKISL